MTKRFSIKTMQLVGATKSFIRKPFLWKSIQHGLIASLLSILFLHFLISYSVNFLPEIQRLHTTNAKLSIYSTILLLGFFIPWACTYFAIRKYLKITRIYFSKTTKNLRIYMENTYGTSLFMTSIG